jgi:3-hydroxybutyryl-CoA dehydratase
VTPNQNMEFLAPVRIGDTVTASVEVVEILPEVKRVKLRTKCVDQNGITVLDGEALVSPPKKRKA